MSHDLFGTLTTVSADLRDLQAKWALVGGIAFQVLVDARFTRDIDFVVAIKGDSEAESLYRDLRARGYRPHPELQVEHIAADRLATLRLIPPAGSSGGVVVDLLFASSGIEAEIVATAVDIEVVPGLVIPVIRKELLLAVKILAGRPKDLQDGGAILKMLDIAEIRRTREALELIDRRGFARNKDLSADFDKLISAES